jgi:hypothetical protein
MSGDVWFLITIWGFSAAVLCFGARHVSDQRIDRWEQRFDVIVDPSTDALVRRRLRAGSAVRWAAFLIGLHITALPMYMNIIDATRSASFANPLTTNAFFFTTALGAVLFEVAVRQRGGPRTALVIRRRRADYVHPFWIRVVLCSTVVTAVATVVAVRDRPRHWQYAWACLAFGVLAAAAITLGVQRIIDRPAIAAEGAPRDADEALRADGAHHVVGAAVALALAATGSAGLLAAGTNVLAWLFAPLPWLGIAWWSRLWMAEPWSVRSARSARA